MEPETPRARVAKAAKKLKQKFKDSVGKNRQLFDDTSRQEMSDQFNLMIVDKMIAEEKDPKKT